MRAKKSVKKNYIYNLLYEIFLIIVPLTVTPYVARVLGENGSGQYSFSYSVSTYFTLFAALGFNVYGQRVIAGHQGNRHQQTVDFWEIMIARLIPTLISTIVYFSTIITGIFDEKYELILIILSLNIVSVAFDVTFFFQGNEEFGRIVLRNFIIKITSIISIFIFVKTSQDLWIYTVIQAGSVAISNISLWAYIPQYLEKIYINDLNFLRHLKPTLVLFLPCIATSVYTSLDKTLIGIITKNDAENGNYEYAEKLIKMGLTVLTSLGTVMSPRNAKKIADGDYKGVVSNIYHTAQYVMFIGLPLMFGFIVISDNLIPWYLGEGYSKASVLLKILSPLIIIIGLSNVIGRQFLIPNKQDKKYTIAIITGACANFVLNILLISEFRSYGAAIATVAAELIVTMVMCFYARSDISIINIVKMSWKYFISSVVMFFICYGIGQLLLPSLKNTMIIATAGCAVYFVLIIVFRDELILGTLKSLKRKKGER